MASGTQTFAIKAELIGVYSDELVQTAEIVIKLDKSVRVDRSFARKLFELAYPSYVHAPMDTIQILEIAS